VAVVEYILGIVDLGRQRITHIVEQIERFRTRDDAVARRGYPACLLDYGDQFVERLEYPVHAQCPPADDRRNIPPFPVCPGPSAEPNQLSVCRYFQRISTDFRGINWRRVL